MLPRLIAPRRAVLIGAGSRRQAELMRRRQGKAAVNPLTR